MAKGKASAAFRDAPLAQNNVLRSSTERFTDDGPFLESDTFHFEDSKLASTRCPSTSISTPTHSFRAMAFPVPEELIDAARKKGLHGFAITDHNTCEAVDYMLEKGFMREDGAAVDNFLIIPGVEVTTAEGHLLCIGTTLPYLKGRPAREVCEIIHDRGGIAIPPHPYDLFRAGIRFQTLETLPIDALEVFNAATTLRRYNRYAFKYAQVRGLPMTAASDAHHAAAVGTAYTIVNTDDFSVKGVLAQILKGNELNQRYLTPKDNVRKTWNNWMRLKRRKRLPEATAKFEE